MGLVQISAESPLLLSLALIWMISNIYYEVSRAYVDFTKRECEEESMLDANFEIM